MQKHSTLKTYLEAELPSSSLAALLLEIAGICTQIATYTSKGALLDIMDKIDGQNVQGETQTKLDVVANDLFVNGLNGCESVAGLLSEELDDAINIRAGEYLVAFDPLDGSSNTAVNVSVGTIFSVLQAPKSRAPTTADYLQAGTQQVAAGYVMYGPSTLLMLTLGKGTHGFTLNPETQTFLLTHPHVRLAAQAAEFAINTSNARFWEPPVARYISECQAGLTGPRGRDFNMRWVASMVADVHRILVRGGVYLYPKDNKQPVKSGRLRLMYEANPMSMLVEQAGGASSTGRARVMEIVPEQIHQRVPVIIGTAQEVALIDAYTNEHDQTT